MFRVILPDGGLDCDHYEQEEYGVELYTADEDLIAFVPYSNLVAIINEEVQTRDDRAIF